MSRLVWPRQGHEGSTFRIRIEGETRLEGHDGFARASFGAAASETFEIAVKGGLLEIERRAQKGGADLAVIGRSDRME